MLFRRSPINFLIHCRPQSFSLHLQQISCWVNPTGTAHRGEIRVPVQLKYCFNKQEGWNFSNPRNVFWSFSSADFQTQREKGTVIFKDESKRESSKTSHATGSKLWTPQREHPQLVSGEPKHVQSSTSHQLMETQQCLLGQWITHCHWLYMYWCYS